MMRLAMHRHGGLRPRPLIHLRDIAAAWMAGAMYEMIVIGDHFDAEIAEIIDDAMNAALIAGNSARREDDAIARAKLEQRMLLRRRPRQLQAV